MGENSEIEWTDHTFNPWIGCTNISPGCDHCYAEAMALRFGHAQWGNHPTLGLTELASAPARAAAGAEDGPDWPGTLKGRRRQVVDAYAPNDGFPLAFAFTFVVTNGPASADLVPATAVVVLRHTAFPFALDHPMWQKYDPCLWMTMGSMLRLGLAGAAAKESAMLRSMPREDRMDTRMHEKIILR